MKPFAASVLLFGSILLGSCASAPADLVNSESAPVFYNLRLTIRDGQREAFARIMNEMVASTKNESGTLVYEWFLAADGKTVQINERFADTAAYVVHSENFGAKFADRFLPCVEVTGLTVYGNPDEKARGMLAGMSPTYLAGIGGFRR